MKKFELKESEANLLFQTALDKLVIRMFTGTIDTLDGLTDYGKTRILGNWTESHIQRGLIRKSVFGTNYTLYQQELLKLYNDVYETAVITYNNYKKDMEHRKLFEINK